MSASTISLLLTILFVVILIAGFFIGFWRGLKKSTANLIFSVVGAILAFFITPVITSAIMGIPINNDGTQITINEYLVEMLKSDANISILITRNPNLNTLIEGLPSALGNVVVFIVFTCLVELVMYIIYRIIASTVLKKKEDEKRHRLWGGAVGLVKVFLLTIFAFMPLAGLVGLYNNISSNNETFMISTQDTTSNTTEESQTNVSIIDNIPPEANEILTGLENNMLIKVCGIFGLDNATFDYYSQVKVENDTIYIRQEIETLYPIFNFAYQIASEEKNINFSEIDYDKLEIYLDSFLEGGLFNGIIVDLANDIIQNYQEYPFINESQDLSKIQNVLTPIQQSLVEYSQNHDMLKQYFSHDIKSLFKAVKTLAQNGLLDEIINMPQDSTIQDILDILVLDANIENTQDAVNDVMQINIVRDAIAPITEMLLENVSEEIGNISVDTSTWNEQDWNDLSTNLVNVVKEYSNLSKEVDIITVVEDPTILISDKNYNITNITTMLGSLIDNARAIKLFYDENGESIIDNFLSKYNISLPTEEVKTANGEVAIIESYSDLFEFISPLLEIIKEQGLYEILNNSSDVNSMMSALANVISQEGNENLLAEIILPLSQVEPTKSFVVEDMIKTINNDLVNLSVLNSYDEWKSDLTYFSSLLVTLNSLEANGQSYLEMALNGNLESIIDNISEQNISSVIKPILYAKSTENIRSQLLNILIDVSNEMTGMQDTINVENITLIEGNSEDQADEICQIFAKFLSINSSYTAGMSIKDLDKTLLGQFLTSLQQNACRTTLSGKTKEGLFKDVYYSLLDTLKTEYQDIISQSEDLQNKLDESNYPYLDFVELFDLIEQIENMQ